jgi:pilus assembly protein CpaB
MATTRSVVHLGAALALSVVVGLTVMQWMQKAQRVDIMPQVALARPEARVAVAAVPMTRGMRVTPDMVRMSVLEPIEVPAGSFADIKPMEGLMVTQPVMPGEVFTPANVTFRGVAAILEPGKRALAVKASVIHGLSGTASTGSVVDVLVTLVDPDKNAQKVTKTVLESVSVLSIAEEAATPRKNNNSKEEPSSAVYTLELTPDEAEKLALATQHGEIHFALRNPADSQTVLTEGAYYERMVTAYKEAKTVPRHAPPKPVTAERKVFTSESIRGVKSEKVSF